MASLPSSISSDFLSNLLKGGGVSLNIVPKYMACFENDFPSGRASQSDFKRWAKDMCYKQEGGVTRKESESIYNLIFN